jgi:hypothetical protein
MIWHNGKEDGIMRWPEVDIRESFEEMEKRLKIEKEIDDIRNTQLGSYPSSSFYSNKDPKINLQWMRVQFDKVAQRY